MPSRSVSADRPTVALDARSRPGSGGLTDRDVHAVEDVCQRDPQQEGGKSGLVVVASCLIPDVVRHRVRTIGESRDALRERQCRSLGVIEVRRLAPGRNGEAAPRLVLADLFDALPVHVNAEAAAVDLAYSQVDQPESLLVDSALPGRGHECLNGFHRFGEDERRVLHPLGWDRGCCGHDASSFTWVGIGHIGALTPVK